MTFNFTGKQRCETAMEESILWLIFCNFTFPHLCFLYHLIVNSVWCMQKESRARRQMEIAARSKVRERRLQSARVRKYYDEYQVRQRSRMLKKRTKEELVTN